VRQMSRVIGYALAIGRGFLVGRASSCGRALNQAASLISITTWARWEPRVISQSHHAVAAMRLCLPRLALIFQPKFIGDVPIAAQGWPSARHCEC
jgi:hypothetical protein